jgi:hypothetical protein
LGLARGRRRQFEHRAAAEIASRIAAPERRTEESARPIGDERVVRERAIAARKAVKHRFRLCCGGKAEDDRKQ